MASTAYTASGNVLDVRQNPVELLVFGYACKIFRDDEKARDLDQGKHLIPWMGDVNLKIDRYDVRGALCDLAPYEAPIGGYGNRLEYLSAEEQRAEQLCEEERYLFLYNNAEEQKLQQEEDLKRLQQETSGGGEYSQVGFQYDGQKAAMQPGSAGDAAAPAEPANPEEGEQPFKVPGNLLVQPPPDMQLPESMKQHAIIEKTARFIATQGAQMEILIKAKQANNAQFDFLTQGDRLQPYYRHLLAAIKECKFAALPEPVAEEPAATAPPSPKRSQVITVPTIKYKPSANCAYTQLISKIKGVPLQAVLDDEGSASNSQHSAGTASPTPSCKSSPSGEFMPVLLQYNGSTFEHAPAEHTCEENANDASPQVELLKNTSALALAQNYSSASDDDDEEEEEQQQEPERPVLNFPQPEESLQHIIDKTATYVIKNGRQFEETLRTKSVERFNFLLPDNEYYPYYMYKITGDVDAASKEEKTRKAAAVAAALLSKKGLTFGAQASPADKSPVCFSIRARDEHAPLQPALPQENSDDEPDAKAQAGAPAAGAESARPGMPDSVQRAIRNIEILLLARSGDQKAASPQKEQRQAEERVKDKLAQIARDKLNGLITREKQLQLERKRKAMAFLNQIKGGSAGLAASNAAAAAPAANSTADCADSDSNDSVRSIPITYFGPDDDDVVEQGPLKTAADDDEDGDLEKYNLLNDDSTNTYTSKAPPPPPPPATVASVLLSDDDDVQLVTMAVVPAVRRIRSGRRGRSRRSSSRQSSDSSDESSRSGGRSYRHRGKRKASVHAHSVKDRIHARKQRTHARSRSRSRSRSATPASSHYRRHKQRSCSRSRSRSMWPSSGDERRYHYHGHGHQREQRQRERQRHEATSKSHKRHKRRRRSSDASP